MRYFEPSQRLKQKLRDRIPTTGTWICIPHPAVVEIMATAGFDWMVIDLEHTCTDLRETEDLIRAMQAEAIVPLVRLTSNDPNQIKRVMDAGAGGVVVPMVGSADEARRAVSATRYPPEGTRGVGLARAQRFGLEFDNYLNHNNTQAIVIVQIEHINAIRDLESILSVEGVDGSIIGPYDLSGSMGIPGQLTNPAVRAALDRYEETSRRMGKAMGFHIVAPDPQLAREKLACGYSIIAFGVDFTFLGTSVRNRLAELRGPFKSEA